MHSLNLGILAHVDAGKTTLTERLLYEAGVLDTPGSVDAGTTRTDTMELERRRGITIRSAVTSFAVRDLAVNLIDTPGHPDFIAEVERALVVLDSAVLVVSAVEGVQPQTVVLWRALERLRVPTVFFVNKVDRSGADPARVSDEIHDRLTSSAVPLAADDSGVLLEALAAYDDSLLERWVAGSDVPRRELDQTLRRAMVAGRIAPVLTGSARTGEGVPELIDAVAGWLPPSPGAGQEPSGQVFKIERDEQGKRVFVRMRSGQLHVRERLSLAGRPAERITGIRVSTPQGLQDLGAVEAGQIGVVRGLESARVGDSFGDSFVDGVTRFPSPVLETVVEPLDPSCRGALFAALTELAEQDPLIALHADGPTQQIAVRLYGEVQKEVIGALLSEVYGVEVTFSETSVVHVERLVGSGESLEQIRVGDNPYLATVGLRAEPAAVGGGLQFELEVEAGSMPPAFFTATEEGIRETLRQGLFGWEIPDCSVTMTHSGYWARQSHAHQRFNKAFSSVAADFRQLAPVVLMAALQTARTVVCEPVHRFSLETPTSSLNAVLSEVSRLGGIPLETGYAGAFVRLEGYLPAARLRALSSRLPDLTGGTGVLSSELDHHRPVEGEPPSRPRRGPDPGDRETWFRERPR